MPSMDQICPNCDALVKGKICLNCGYTIEDSEKATNTESPSSFGEKTSSLIRNDSTKSVDKETKDISTSEIPPTSPDSKIESSDSKSSANGLEKKTNPIEDDSFPTFAHSEEKKKDSAVAEKESITVSAVSLTRDDEKENIPAKEPVKTQVDKKDEIQKSNGSFITSPKPEDITSKYSEKKVDKPIPSMAGEDVDMSESLKTDVSEVEKKEEGAAVRSIFTDMAAKDGRSSSDNESEVKTQPVEKSSSKLFAILPVSLFLLLGGIIAFAYYQFVYHAFDYVSPVVESLEEEVLSSSQTAEENKISDLNGNEKTIAVQSDLKEGNFARYDFSSLVPPDVNMVVQLFDLKHIFEKFISDRNYQAILSEFDISENDSEVFLSSEFALVYPDNDLNSWGFIQYVKNENFVKERLADFEKKKESEKYEYNDYFASLVKVEKDEDSDVLEESSESVTVNEKDVVGPEIQSLEEESNDDEEAESEQKSQSPDFYLLISNSKEFLDRMKEISEGVLPSLSDDLMYSQSKVKLPLIGDAFVYRDPESPSWDFLVSLIAPYYEYVGLDKILTELKSPSMVFYSKDEKLKIVTSVK